MSQLKQNRNLIGSEIILVLAKFNLVRVSRFKTLKSGLILSFFLKTFQSFFDLRTSKLQMKEDGLLEDSQR